MYLLTLDIDIQVSIAAFRLTLILIRRNTLIYFNRKSFYEVKLKERGLLQRRRLARDIPKPHKKAFKYAREHIPLPHVLLIFLRCSLFL